MTNTEQTFMFADLAGFTSLTEVHGDEFAATVALDFCCKVNAVLPEDAEDLKMLGDACLIRVGDPDAALAVAVALVTDIGHEGLDVKVGMNTGTAVLRGDEWFGATLNIAARVAALAAPGEVLLTAATRDRLTASAPPVEACGRAELRGVSEAVALFRPVGASAPSSVRWVADPVCRMRLNPALAATSLRHDGTDFYFCSATCSGAFARRPERYVRDRAASD